MCEIVGEKAGVDSSVVWNAFVRGIFYHGTLENSDAKKWFTSAISPTFLSELGGCKDDITFSKLMNKYNILT